MVFENLYMYILEVETTLFVELKRNPFMFDNVPLVDTMFYVERIYNLLTDKYENMDEGNVLEMLLQRLL